MDIQKNMLELVSYIEGLDLDEKVEAINFVRSVIHDISPFRDEPVDFVKWVKNDTVVSNDYNPNKVAPTEMKLLELSIHNDGYTQPIVSWSNPEKDKTEVIDGFHRHRVGKESKAIRERVKGYLPVVDIRKEQSGKKDRIASTIRHNRARGKHQIDAMSEIVIELKNRNWKNSRIARELGMDEEEVLRLCQISGLENLFSDKDFSRAWEAQDSLSDADWQDITDDDGDDDVRIPHMNDEQRIFHTYHHWECHKAGFYASNVEGKTKKQCEEEYKNFLSDKSLFKETLEKVITEWKFSCEHYLTNKAMNRIAWLGQASACYALGLPSKFCGGFNLMSEEERHEANLIALDALNKWLTNNGMDVVSLEQGLNATKQVELY